MINIRPKLNYRPISLTCITCKLFEHIICRHVLGHLEQHKILTELQHGFRSGRSCEIELITTFQDIAESYDKKGSQIDIAVLDFSKAFNTVPHDGILSKLKHYGIAGLGSSTVDQVLKYTKYPKYIPSTSTGQVLIFFKKYLSTSSTFISSTSTSTSNHIKICTKVRSKFWMEKMKGLSPNHVCSSQDGHILCRVDFGVTN